MNEHGDPNCAVVDVLQPNRLIDVDPGDQFWLTVPVESGFAGVEVHREGDKGWTWLKAGEFLLVQYNEPGEYTIRFRSARAARLAPFTVRVFAPPADAPQPRGHNGQAGAGGVQALAASGGASFSLGSVYAGRYTVPGTTNQVDKYPLSIYCTAVGGDCSIWPYRGSWTNTYPLAVNNGTSDVIDVPAGQICTLIKSCGGTQTLSPNNPSRLKVKDLILTNGPSYAPVGQSVTNRTWELMAGDVATLAVIPGPNWVTNNPAAAASLFLWTTNNTALPAPTDLTQTFTSNANSNLVNVACNSPYPASPTSQSTTIVMPVDIGIKRYEGTLVSEGIEHSNGSVVQLVPKDNPEGIYLEIAYLRVAPSLLTTYWRIKLKKVGPTTSVGKLRVYRNGAVFMDETEMEKDVSVADLGSSWKVDATVGGVVDLALVVEDVATGVELARDVVRISAIPCKPGSGRIIFVNPASTGAAAPYDDFENNAAHTIVEALNAMQANDNILIARGTYFENNLVIAHGGVVAGLAGRWLVDNPSAEPPTTPLADKFDFATLSATALPTISPPAGAPTASLMRTDGVVDGGQIAVAGLSFQGGVAGQIGGLTAGGALRAENLDSVSLLLGWCRLKNNQASEFGGAVYMKSVTSARIDTCEFLDNKVDYNDGGQPEVFDRGMGGAIATFQSALTVTNVILERNLAQVSNGGGVPTGGNAGGGGDVYLNRGALTMSRSRSSGAQAGFPRLRVDPSDETTYFTGDGGSVLVHGEEVNTVLNITDSVFERAQSYGNGGGISLSRDSSPKSRRYFVLGPSLEWPPIDSEPFALGGGCVGVVSNVVFRETTGGWHGGGISANGRGMKLRILDCLFDSCVGGGTHLRDGKGGGLTVGGGVQANAPAQNDVLVSRGDLVNCSATGNGGGAYSTIRGSLRMSGTVIYDCIAQNAAAKPKIEGMGGGIHVSAGGIVDLASVQLLDNTAAVSGGGLSVKSGSAYVGTDATIEGNVASGNAAAGYGNGGGVFVTTSYHDDLPIIGAGWGAATVYDNHGFLFALGTGINVRENEAARWGGGLYAGISPPWYDILPPKNVDHALVTLKFATVQNNICGLPTNKSQLKPAQIAAERLQPMPPAVLDFSNTTIGHLR